MNADKILFDRTTGEVQIANGSFDRKEFSDVQKLEYTGVANVSIDRSQAILKFVETKTVTVTNGNENGTKVVTIE